MLELCLLGGVGDNKGEAIENCHGFRQDLFFLVASSGPEEKVDERNVGWVLMEF